MICSVSLLFSLSVYVAEFVRYLLLLAAKLCRFLCPSNFLLQYGMYSFVHPQNIYHYILDFGDIAIENTVQSEYNRFYSHSDEQQSVVRLGSISPSVSSVQLLLAVLEEVRRAETSFKDRQGRRWVGRVPYIVYCSPSTCELQLVDITVVGSLCYCMGIALVRLTLDCA